MIWAKSFWKRGVKEYAIDFIENIEDDEIINKRSILNGAQDFKEYSYSGLTLIYDKDIAKRLCTPSKLKITKNGKKLPNQNENC